MKKTITCILLTAGLTGYLSAQTPVQDKSDKNSGKVPGEAVLLQKI